MTPRQRLRHSLVCAFVVACIFLPMMVLHGRLTESCVHRCSAFLQYELRDPYCILDPTCVSPGLSRSEVHSYHGGMGLAWIDDKSVLYGHGLSSLAKLNFVLFFSVGTLVLALARLHLAGYRRVAVYSTVVTWTLLSTVLWSLTLADYDPTFHVYDGVALVVIGTVIPFSILGVVSRLASSRGVAGRAFCDALRMSR